MHDARLEGASLTIGDRLNEVFNGLRSNGKINAADTFSRLSQVANLGRLPHASLGRLGSIALMVPIVSAFLGPTMSRVNRQRMEAVEAAAQSWTSLSDDKIINQFVALWSGKPLPSVGSTATI